MQGHCHGHCPKDQEKDKDLSGKDQDQGLDSQGD